MRYLILTDIHANIEALNAVVNHAKGSYDQILHLGDLVGYGPDPNAVVDWCRAHGGTFIRGNHDKACVGGADLQWFNPIAREAVEWTVSVLTAENRDFLGRLPQGPVIVDGIQLFHGSPVDEDDYIVDEMDVESVERHLRQPISFFGHTHLQCSFTLVRKAVRRLDTTEFVTDDRYSYLVNPGSVGQPRDHDPRAAYAVYDTVSRLVSLRRAPYDVNATQRKVLRAGLPEMLATRLWVGA